MNKDDKKDALYAYLTAEANLMSQIAKCSESVDTILKTMAGDEAKKYESYMADEDYKTMFNMDDELIKQWVFYAKNVLGRPELVDNRPEKSFITSKKKARTTPNVTKGGIVDKGMNN